MFFKGYVETKDKKCIEKFKNRSDFKTYDQVKSRPEFAGILADDAILIDVDDPTQSDVMMNIVEDLQLNCRVYKTTRGKHFLFKNTKVDKCYTHANLACGIRADIKSGFKNAYEVLKFNDLERFIEWDIEKGMDYQELPKWMYPIKCTQEFLNMDAGDGRNQSLYNYILILQANDYTVEEARECIRIINKHVLKVPLSDDEIETVLRNDSFKQPIFFKGTTFLFDKFATYLKNNCHIIKINNQLHIYKDGIYISGQQEIEAEMIKQISNLNRAKRTEVMEYLNLMIRENTSVADANMIAFRNGLLNIIDNGFIPFTHEHVITNRINCDYNSNAYSELADMVLNKMACNDFNIRMLLEEVIGYCFYRRNELGKAFILTGDKSNGKSTFLDIVRILLGDENTSALDLVELGDRFKTAELFGKLANIGDDIGDEFIANTSVFKKLVTGNSINVERKGQDPFDFNNYSKLLFSANNIPRIGKGKDSDAILRRLVIIPFEAKFSSDDPDYRPYIKYELSQQDSIEYLIKLGVQGLKRVLENNKFTESEKVKEEMKEYEVNNNPIIGFFKETERNQIDHEPTCNVYKLYQEYCLRDSLQSLSKIEFSKQVKKYYNFEVIDKKVNGKKYRIFAVKGKANL